MKVPVTLRVAAVGLELQAELEIPDDLLRTAGGEPDTLTDADLRQRWRCSARTLKRMRDRRELPFHQPSPRKFLYAVEDVERLEDESRRERSRAVPSRAG